MAKIKLGIIKEGKVPPDSRVILTPKQCKELVAHYPDLEIYVQSSAARCYPDAEYAAVGIPVVDDISHCEILAGIKEVPVAQLIEGKTYLMFSHTHKGQVHNRPLLKAAVEQHIKLVDYELLTNEKGIRLIAFGYYAGLVGAHNGIMMWGERTGLFHLNRVHSYQHFEELKDVYRHLELPPMKIVVTGSGRVASGVVHVLDLMGVKRLEKEEYLAMDEPTEAVYVQLDTDDLYEHKDQGIFINSHFYKHPSEYHSVFAPYTRATDLLINAIYWDEHAPRYFTKEEIRFADFRIQAIADITCDIGGSVPCTLRATTIAAPYMGYDAVSEHEIAPFQKHGIDIMSIDNLPNELPRDASAAFGEQLLHSGVIEELLGIREPAAVQRATICDNGHLRDRYHYLEKTLFE